MNLNLLQKYEFLKKLFIALLVTRPRWKILIECEVAGELSDRRRHMTIAELETFRVQKHLSKRWWPTGKKRIVKGGII